MATPIKTDAHSLHKRMALILAKQLSALRRKQVILKGELGLDDVRSFKILADCLDDQIRLRRLIEQDNKKDLNGLSDERLEALANGANSAPNVPKHSSGGNDDVP